MTDHEREIVKRALSYASKEIRAAQRCVEVLANLFEDLRLMLYPEQASRLWHVLNRIPNIERIPLYPDGSDKNWNQAAKRYRWVFMEHAMPAFELHRLGNDVDELSVMLSGVKIEDVAQSKAMEAHERYVNSQRFIPSMNVPASILRDLDTPDTVDTIKPKE